jgi:hypothetical protein
LEQIGKPARPEVLDELAKVTRGRVLTSPRVDEVVKAVSDVPEPPKQIRRVQLWSHPLVAMTLIAFMGVFWVGRKMVGLI